MSIILSKELNDRMSIAAVQKLKSQNRFDDIKLIVQASGKNCQAAMNQECLRVLEEQMTAEDYSAFYNNLKD